MKHQNKDNWFDRKVDEALIIRGFGETPLINRDKGCYIKNIWSTVIEKRTQCAIILLSYIFK